MKTFILCLLFSFNVKAELQAPEYGSCNFYLSLEKTIPCGPAGYAKDFGYFYCEQFLKAKAYRFSVRGKDFLAKNAFCLQDEIYRSYMDNPHLSCQQIESRAFKDHVNCYTESDFCELSISDKVILTNIIKKQLPLKIARDQIKEVLKRCRQQ